ncbi:MAG: helicase [Anaerolineae bacterium]|nr:helicase [Anaerolineae bacterium]
MPHDIIDNRTERLIDHIRRVLPGSQACKFAVGYFFLSGLEAIADQLDRVRDLRLLIGNTSNRETIEQIAEGYRRLEQVRDMAEAVAYPKRTDMDLAVARTAENLGQAAALMDQTDEAEQLVSALIRLIQEGRLQVRVYTKGRLHAKAYIFDYPLGSPYGQGMGIVGSSNLTLSGITTNTELNVKVLGDANHAELTRWFDALWEESAPFDDHLMRELNLAWPLAEVTPYEVYLKTLYELVRERLEDAEADEFLWRDDITAALTEFQEQAVRQAIQMIRRYNGCFVADVVGLGKSYIGAAIVKHFERRDRARPLIVCPAALVEMWDHYNEAYQLNARVLSMGLLREREPHGIEWMLYDERYSHRDFVLIDESHNYRNTDTQRYDVLASYLGTGDRRCVLLTATPRNKTVWNIYNQLRLFHLQDLTDVPVDPPHLRQYFSLVESGKRRLPALLAHLLIRRTRPHILRWYGYDAETDQRVNPDDYAPYRNGERRAYILVGGERQFFPQRQLQTISYSIDATYRGLYQDLTGFPKPVRSPVRSPPVESPSVGSQGQDLTGLGKPVRSQPRTHSLTYARYGLWHYVHPAKRNVAPYAELQRAGANLRGLIRIMLFKRFESSVHAFRETVRRLLRIHETFLAAMRQGIMPAGEEAQRLLYESDQEEEQLLIDALGKVSGRYRLADFTEALEADIVHDTAVLQEMLNLVEPITPGQDAKLQTLLHWLRQPPVCDGKRLIFTQYADTARYLYQNLDPGGNRPEIDAIYSSNRSKGEVVGRFAPRANPEHRPPPGTPEIETLVATDVLSEGLNLQDCDCVINYDLHWNPVRLIQRFGRIDRIGSTHDAIYGYNFLPETELDKNLGLRERLAARIREIHETIGEDAAILDPAEQLNEEAMYAIYTGGDIGRYEDDDTDEYLDWNEAEEIIRQLQQDQPELYHRIATLRDGVRCGRSAAPQGAIVFCRAGNYRQLCLVDGQGEIVDREIPRILGILKCEPDTPAAPLPEGYNQLVMGVKRRFDQEVQARSAERRHTVSLTRAQRYILRELRLLFERTTNADLQRQIALLEAAIRQPIVRPAVRNELNRLPRDGVSGMALLEALDRIYHLYGLNAVRTQQETGDSENDLLPRIVCSEALVR